MTHHVARMYRGLVARLGRITSSGRFIPEVDGLRFIAIFSVFTFHLSNYLTGKSATAWAVPVEQDWLARAVSHGHYGVHLFFAISGFILGLPFAAQHLRGAPPVLLRSYFLRRLTRLEPPYLISLVAIYGLLVVSQGVPAVALFPNLLASCCYVHNLVFFKLSLINPVAWSLEVEVQFYILAPLLARLFTIPGRWRRRLAIVGLAYAAVAFQGVCHAAGARMPVSIPFYLQFFLVGFLLADVYTSDWAETPRRSFGWDAVWIAGWAALFVIWEHQLLTLVLFPPLLFLLLVAAFNSRCGRWILASSFPVTVGGMCYTIYLIHMPLISLIGRVTNRIVGSRYYGVHLVGQDLAVGAAVLVASASYFLLIEKPCMRKDWPLRAWASVRQLCGWWTGNVYRPVGREAGGSPASTSQTLPRAAA